MTEELNKFADEEFEKLMTQIKAEATLTPERLKEIEEEVRRESPELRALEEDIKRLTLIRDVLEGKYECKEQDGKIVAVRR